MLAGRRRERSGQRTVGGHQRLQPLGFLPVLALTLLLHPLQHEDADGQQHHGQDKRGNDRQRQGAEVATTIDGIYRGQATISLPRELPLPGFVTIRANPFAPLREYQPRHFAARFAVAPSCDDTRSARWVPVAFGAQPPSTVRVLVQAGNVPPEIVVSNGLADLDSAERVPCMPIESGRKTSFDHECRLPFDARFAGEKELRVYVRGGKTPRPYMRSIHVR